MHIYFNLLLLHLILKFKILIINTLQCDENENNKFGKKYSLITKLDTKLASSKQGLAKTDLYAYCAMPTPKRK
jgi:hypothetical protein